MKKLPENLGEKAYNSMSVLLEEVRSNMKAFVETQSAMIEKLKEIKNTLTQKADREELLIQEERIKKLEHTLHS